MKVKGVHHYLRRAINHEGEVLGSFATMAMDEAALSELMKKVAERHGCAKPIITDILRSHRPVMKKVVVEDRQEAGRWTKNRASNSHKLFRRRKRAVRCFRRMKTLQQFASTCSAFHNHINQRCDLVSRNQYQERCSTAPAADEAGGRALSRMFDVRYDYDRVGDGSYNSPEGTSEYQITLTVNFLYRVVLQQTS